MERLAEILMIVGSVFILLAGVGVVRFRAIYARMHAAAKAPTLGVLLICLGVALAVRTTEAVVTVLLVIVLQAIAGPVGSHVMARSVYRRLRPPLDGVDELAAAESAERELP
jgi:multicomponent Na+:H+ antiporter subunit G